MIKRAKQNTSVTKKSEGMETTLKEGTPLDHEVKHGVTVPQGKVVGLNIGCTKSMGGYESLRVDTWLSVPVEENETIEGAFIKVREVLDTVLEETVLEYCEE